MGRGTKSSKAKKGNKKASSGPKGKKARAKAKLDKRWGEDVSDREIEASRVRRGRSRLGVKKSNNSSDESSGRRRSGGFVRDDPHDDDAAAAAAMEGVDEDLDDDESSYDSSSSTEGGGGAPYPDNDGDGGGDALRSLLTRIGGQRRSGAGPATGSKSHHRRGTIAQDGTEDDDDSLPSSDGGGGDVLGAEEEALEEDDTSTEEGAMDDGSNEDAMDVEQNDPEHPARDGKDSDDDDDDGAPSRGGSSGGNDGDPFSAHFDKPPLPESGGDGSPAAAAALAEALAPSQKVRKVPARGTCHIDPALDVSLSGPIWERIVGDRQLQQLRGSGGVGGVGEASAKEEDEEDARRIWNITSSGPYGHLRKVLVQNWMGTNAQSLRRNADGVLGGGGGGDGGMDSRTTGGTKKKKKKKGISPLKQGNEPFTALQATIYPSLSAYADVLITAETRENRHDIHNLIALHILNHVLTSRSRVQKHNRRRKQLSERNGGASGGNNNGDGDGDTKEGGAIDKGGGVDVNGDDDDEQEERWRDQGYTRPKVVVLLPTRGTCLSLVRRMVSLLGESASVDHMERFEAEYSAPPEDDEGRSEDDEEGTGNSSSRQRRKAILEAKGSDWNELFGPEANDDDDFKVAMSLTPNVVRVSKKGKPRFAASTAGGGGGGVSVKLYSEFYRSDIILASPLGLKMATSSDDDEDGGDADRDFLSSIEICLVPHADIFLMQNWDHVNSCLDSINHQPTKSNDTDFSRVRNYLLAGQSAHWRQLIFVSRLADPYIVSSFKRRAKSIAGRLKLRRRVPPDEASICDVLVRVRQVFQRVPCRSVSTQGDDRLRYFTDRVLPQMMRLRQKRTLIYIPSYFDFIAVRNALLKKEASFVSVTEYARVSEVSRGRARFVQGRKNIMLYTGRAHFFLRHSIKGARHIILFGLPEHSEFYPELMNMLMEGPAGGGVDNGGSLDVEAPPSCLALFTKYDAHSLERIVGTVHCERMIKGQKSTFLFCS